MAEQLYASLLAKATLLANEGEREAALLSLQEAALAIEKEFGPNDKRRAVAIEQQVDLFRSLGRHRQADAALQEATRIRLKRMRGAGRSLEQQQKYAEAEQLFRNALNISEQAYGPDHRETATCLDNLATCLRKQSRFVDAVTYCSTAKGIRERVLGDSHSHTATSYCNLGFLYRSLGRYDEAQTLLAKSLKVREKRLGPDHPHVAESLDRLAALCRDLGRFEEAAQLCERGLRIREEALGPGHPLTAASLNNLALSREGRITTRAKTPSPGIDRNDAYVSYSFSEETESPPGDKDNEKSPDDRQDKDEKTAERQNHLTGFLLIGGLITAITGTAFAFWLLPAAGVIAASLVIIIGAGSLLQLISFEAILIKVATALRSIVHKESFSAKDQVFLGEVGGAQNVDISAKPAANILTGRHARALARLDYVDLDHVSVLTLAAAEELGKHRGTLRLNAIKAVRSKLARPLGNHVGCLQLNGATLVTAAATAYLCRHTGDVYLNGLHEMSPQHAEHFAQHVGVLSLNGIKTIDEETAAWLIKHKGRLSLLGLRLVSKRTVSLLRTSSLIQIPTNLGEGI